MQGCTGCFLLLTSGHRKLRFLINFIGNSGSLFYFGPLCLLVMDQFLPLVVEVMADH